MGTSQEQRIKVFVRVRPKDNCKECLSIVDKETVKIQDSYFGFDEVFGCAASQQGVFERVGRQICDQLFEGCNGTIFAYGQTGSGKTYTIFGDNLSEDKQGLIFRAISHIVAKKEAEFPQAKLKCSLVELYKEEFIDMFAGQKELKLKETKSSGVYIEGLKEVPLQSKEEIMKLLREASKHRKVAATRLNQQSSRSHTILTVYLQSGSRESKLCLIDLAGSEKVDKSEVKGASFEETRKINYSLSCLGNVINALTTRGQAEHIPFRDSKLTRLLKDSLTGNFLTSVIVNCSSAEHSLQETLSSLKFAERAKKVKLNIQHQQPPESIPYLRSVIEKLHTDLEQTKKELNQYKQTDRAEPALDQVPNVTNRSIEASESGRSELELTGRNPIPSERANVEESLKNYVLGGNVLPLRRLEINLQDISSLNVSKSMRREASPMPDHPDLSLSFSMHGEDDSRKASTRWLGIGRELATGTKQSISAERGL